MAAQIGGRRGARYGAIQAIYRWLMNEVSIDELMRETANWEHLKRMDEEHFEAIVRGVVKAREELDAVIDPHLDRPLTLLDPMEHGLLLVGVWELRDCIEIPVQVVVNEAVELAKLFGATDGHKFINGVLDGIAKKLRPHEPVAHG